MKKTCRDCKNCSNSIRYCKMFDIYVEHMSMATYCKEFNTERDIEKVVHCKNCRNINKFGYCSYKRRCFDEIEIKKDRHCRSFSQKKRKYGKSKK